ncbi:formimidoylglutamase [bacterium]|nr:formimidoylglutamase [bacterium]
MQSSITAKLYTKADLAKYTSSRLGESKLGEGVKVTQELETLQARLDAAHKEGALHCILLIPEDIGPRANLGRAGSNKGPEAFLQYFLNMQHNALMDPNKVLILGEIAVEDLMLEASSDDIDGLRQLCKKLDERVAPVVEAIADAGLELVVIGGGNNNSFPIMEGIVKSLRKRTGKKELGLSVVNCDPHADFRLMEGRHSGNGFNYAHDAGYLKKYCVFGLHENYNSLDTLKRMDEAGFISLKWEDFAIRKNITFDDCIKETSKYLHDMYPVGIELDMDAIENMPTSARTPFGINLQDAAHYIHTLAYDLDSKYLHLSEAAPPLGNDDSDRQVGKSLALLVVTYLKARQEFKERRAHITRLIDRS